MALAVGVLGAHGHLGPGVGAVVDGQRVARLEPPGPAFRAKLGGDLKVGADRHARRRAGGLTAVGARGRDDLERPRAGLRLGRTRRMQVNLDLLLVGTARPVRNEVRRCGGDRPPFRRQPPHAQVEIVDHLGLIADQPKDRDPNTRLNLNRHGLARGALAIGQAERERRAAGGRDRHGGGSERRIRVGHHGDLGRTGDVNRLFAIGHRGAAGGGRGHRAHDVGRLPAQVLAALAEVRMVGIRATAGGAGPHCCSPSDGSTAARTRSR